jgi:hypothetical protein
MSWMATAATERLWQMAIRTSTSCGRGAQRALALRRVAKPSLSPGLERKCKFMLATSLSEDKPLGSTSRRFGRLQPSRVLPSCTESKEHKCCGL